MLATLSFIAFACGEDDAPDSANAVDTVESAMIDECDPDVDFNSCHAIYLDGVDTWQSTTSNPDWRSVEPVSGSDLDYEIVIDAFELNGGVIPTATNQGHYEDWEHFEMVYSDLIGLDTEAGSYVIVQIGTTVKMTESGQPTTGSTGLFLYDALSDEDGRIFVEGQDVTEEILHEERFHDTDQSIYENGSWEPVDQSGTQLQGLSTLDSETTLQSGAWAADLMLTTTPQWGRDLPHKVVMDLSNVRKNHMTCHWQWNFPFYDLTGSSITNSTTSTSSNILVRQCATADLLYGGLHVKDALEDYSQVPSDLEYEFDDAHDTSYLSIEFNQGNHGNSIEACGVGNATFTAQDDDGDFVILPAMDPSDCLFGVN